jgi:hypothetical protein
VVNVQLVLLNPRKRIKVFLVMLFPRITDNVIPLFESIRIRLQICMLAPPLEVLNALETFIKAEDNTVGIFFSSWGHL